MSPALGAAHHFFVERLAVFLLIQLKIPAARVGGQGQQDGPFILEGEEGLDRVFAHIRRYGDSIKAHCFKKGAGILGGSIADIPPFGIGNGEMLGGDVIQGLAQGFPAAGAAGFVESQVGFVSYAQATGRIDNLFVELEQRVVVWQQMGGQALPFGIEPDAEEGLFVLNLLEKLLARHALLFKGRCPK